MEAPLTVLFFGSPGAGKSSQLKLLDAHVRDTTGGRTLPFLWSEVRDAFLKGNAHIHKRIREQHRNGKLYPPFLSVSLWGPKLMEELSEDTHLLVDGLPRQQLEGMLFDSLLEFYERDPVYVVHLEVPDEVALARLKGRGEDQDVPEAIKERLAWYATDTLPLLEFFKESPRYRVITCDGTKDREEVFRQILEGLGK